MTASPFSSPRTTPPSSRIERIATELATRGIVPVRRACGCSKLGDLFRAIGLFEIEKAAKGQRSICRVRRK